MSGTQLKEFLDELGLIEYLGVFAAEKVELGDLPYLTDADLSALGLPLGPRRRLMRAVARTDAPADGERRNLTVLFCDMVGSSAIAARIDPEDLRLLYRAFRETCVAAIEAEVGFVAHRLGDGLMAHFGYPRALEDAAIRAVRAGLEIVDGVARLALPSGPVEVRVGIASGMTVIEQMRSGIAADDEMATGATLSLAARLQALAPPGSVVVSDATHLLLRDAFDLEPLGPQALKGFPEKEPVWRARRKAHEHLPFAPDVAISTRFVGRTAESAVLLDGWRACTTGRGCTVVIEGEPGIGKSRTLAELHGAASGTGDVIVLHCSRYRQGAALHPVAEWLKASIAADGAADPAAWLAARPGMTAEAVPPVARLLSLVPDDGDDGQDPLQRQNAILDAVTALLSPVPDRPRLMLVEDVQWADMTTLDVLDRLAERCGSLPLMMVAATRPGAKRLPRGPGVRTVPLLPLSLDETRDLITAQAGADALPEALCRTIAERSGGVPFFVEELTRAVLEVPDGDVTAVPVTLQDTLMARLDRLDAGKGVAQIGALIGRSFSVELLSECSDLPDASLRAGLSELVSANLVETRGASDYAFRHALVREAAYGSLLRSRRLELHRRVARTLVAQFPSLAEAQPETVARHFAEAGEIEPALDYWEKAAERNIAQAAPAAAITCFEAMLGLLERLPESEDRNQREMALRIRLNMPMTVTTGFASTETEGNLARLATLLEEAEPTDAALQLLWSRCMSALVRADLVAAAGMARRMKRIALRAPLANATRMPERMLAYVAMLEGQLDVAEAHFRHVMDGFHPDGFDPILPGHPFDVLASTLSQWAILMALRDEPGAVDESQSLALMRARRLGSPATSFQVLVHLCLARFELGDFDAVPALLSELREVVDRNELAPLYADLWSGWLRARSGAFDEGLAEMTKALSRDTQYPLWSPRSLLLRAGLLIDGGRVEEALGVIDECESKIGEYRHSYLLAEARRHRATCLSRIGAPDGEVESLLRSAADIAADQGARRFEKAAQEDLARLLERRAGHPIGDGTQATGTNEAKRACPTAEDTH